MAGQIAGVDITDGRGCDMAGAESARTQLKQPRRALGLNEHVVDIQAATGYPIAAHYKVNFPSMGRGFAEGQLRTIQRAGHPPGYELGFGRCVTIK